jgi:hypothetical protein
MMAASVHKWGIKEAQFRPRFLKACSKGLVTFESFEDLKKGMMDRLVVPTKLGEEAIRDIGILQGGDYSYFRYMDPIEAQKDPTYLDRFCPSKITVQGGGNGYTKEQLQKMGVMQTRGGAEPRGYFRGF